MESLRRIAPGAYFVAALLILITAVDYIGNAWPFRPGDVDWRYQVVGMLSTYLLSPLLGCLIASITAAWLPHPRMSKAFGVFMWIGALLLLAALAAFLLDSIQMRGSVKPDARWVTTTSFILASGKIVAASLGLMILGWGNLRAGAVETNGVGSRKRAPAKPIVGAS